MKEYSVNEYAKKVGVSNQAIAQRIRRGKLFAEFRNNRWVVLEPETEDEMNQIAGRETEPPKTQMGSSEPATGVDAERLRKERAVATLKEIEVKTKLGQLISVLEVKRQAYRSARMVRDAILNIPQKIAAELACETDPHKVELMMATELRQALEELADSLEEPEQESDSNQK